MMFPDVDSIQDNSNLSTVTPSSTSTMAKKLRDSDISEVVDCRARNTADGSVQQKQRKQLEVFQAQGPGGSLQVIRTQSITSSSSSKTTGWNRTPAITAPDFENLQLTLNPLNLSSEKTKASVGRSGSLGGRRPPSRPRSLINKIGSAISGEEDHLDDVNLRLSEVSRLCQQIKGEAQKRHSDFFNALEIPPLEVPLRNRNGLNGSVHDDLTIEVSPVIIEQIDDSDNGETETLNRSFPSEERPSEGLPNGTRHKVVHRKKSSSIEDLQCINDYKDVQKESDNEEDLRRFSKVRRSLQLSPKSSHTIQDLPPIGNVLKIRQELEEKRKFNVPCLKNHEVFENVLKRGEDIINSEVFRGREFNLLAGENKKYITKSASENRTDDKTYEGFSRRVGNTDSGSPKKCHSFITAESLKVVRERLRRTSPPSTENTQNANPSVKYAKDNEEQDDGIETEDIPRSSRMDSLSEMEDSPSISRVKSYVYGMESISKSNRSGGRKPPQGTGSLESRTSNRSSSSSGSRTEEWYNRRKSYGFEKVHNTEIVEPSSLAKFKEKNRIESSTDSGICRSTELISLHSLPIKARPPKETTEDMNFNQLRGSINPKKSPSVFVSKMYSNEEDQNFEGRKTFVTLGNESMNSKNDRLGITEPTQRKSVTNHQSDYHHEAHFINNSQTGAVRGKEFKGVQSLIDNLNTRGNSRLSQALTISIPIVSEETSHNEDETGDGNKIHALQHHSEFKNLNTDRPWKKTPVTLNGNETTTQNSYNFESNASSWRVRDGWQQQVKPANEELKRHSIAVDESVYERGGINRHGNTNYVNQPSFEHSFSKVSLSAPFPSSSELIKRRASLGAAASSHPKEQILTSGIRVSFNNNTDSVLDKALEYEDDNEENSQQNCTGKKTKRVEFCKTEVHFAAEPGRFNIVETDEKPPPNNMFRRRRRNTPSTLSGQESDPNKSNLPQIRFGDSLYEKTLLSSKETGEDIPTTNQISKSEALFNKSVSEIISTKYVHQANIEDVADKEDNIHTESNATITTPSNRTSYFPVFDKDDDNGQHYDSMTRNISEENQPRSILKNNRKSRISHSGEEIEMAHILSEGEDAKGNSLGVYHGDKGPSQNWRSSLTMQNNKTSDDENIMMIARSDKDVKHCDGESEIKKLLRSLRPTSDKHVGTCILSRVPEDPPNLTSTTLDSGVEVKIASAGPPSYWSVADRIKQVEKKSYSTKVNFGVGEATVVEGMEKTGIAPCRQEEKINKPTWLSKEERNLDFLDREDSKEEKGLVIRICRQEVSNKEQAVEKPPAIKSSMTTKISIDVKPSVLSENKRSKFASAETKSTNIAKNIHHGKSELLQSPSLIMKTIQKPFTQVQKLSRKFEELPIVEKTENNQPKGSLHMEIVEPISSARHINSSIVFKEFEESNAKTKVSDALDYWRNRVLNTKKKVSLKDIKVCQKPPSPYKNVSSDSDEDVATIRQTREKDSFILGELGVSNHLAALKEMYFKSDDDSERADEEVRSIMSGGAEEEMNAEEDGSSIVSGSWSRMRAFRNVRHHFHKFNGTVDKDSLLGQQRQVSLATTTVPSYGESSNLSSIETLVSTRSGQPKITSISLKYKGDKGQDRDRSDNSKEELRTKRRSPSQERHESLSALDNLVRSLTPVKSETPQPQYNHLNVSKHAKEVRSKEKETNKKNSNAHNQLITSSLEKLRNHEDQRNLSRSHMKQSKEVCNKNNTNKMGKQTKNNKIDKESNILEELTKAADQILQAVNGYTDEESCKASSTDDDDEELERRKGKRVGQVRKPSACLSTISEAPSSKKKDDTKSSSGVTHSRSNSNVRINQRLSKSRLGPTSSTSSVESFTKEIRRASTAQTRMLLKQERAISLDVRTKGNTTSSSKPMSRTARLLQRASSRELLLQSHGSSSEDLGTGENEMRRQRTHRRARSSIASNKKESTPPLEGCQPARSRKEITYTSKTRESDCYETVGLLRRASPAPLRGRSTVRQETWHGPQLLELQDQNLVKVTEQKKNAVKAIMMCILSHQVERDLHALMRQVKEGRRKLSVLQRKGAAIITSTSLVRASARDVCV
uniref:Uncharacterized protein n=1 Tax=Timema cristinae TaxID=61476 RepID=A0A7R9CSD9_TIMCR|nr:unnamed protein product [Timema cristinae]